MEYAQDEDIFFHSGNIRKCAGSRSVCPDAYGTGSVGKKYDLEVQRQDKGAVPYRARYHSSVMDIENLHSGQEFKELPDTYTIFIIEKDFYGQGKAVYPIERINLATGKFFVNLIKSPLQSVTGEVCEGMGGGWYGQGALPDFVSGAEPLHNLPTADEVVRTVLPLE